MFLFLLLRWFSLQKVFMDQDITRASRSGILVRLRIGSFGASDAGSNPAGSMLFLNTPLRPEGGSEDLRRDLEPIPGSFGAEAPRDRLEVPAKILRTTFWKIGRAHV